MMAVLVVFLFFAFFLISIVCSGGDGWLKMLEKLNAQTSSAMEDRLRSAGLAEVDRGLFCIALKYAELGTAVYKRDLCLLRNEAAQSIKVAAKIALALGFKIKMLDSFRPVECDVIISNQTGEESSSNHSRGVTVDVSLIDIATSSDVDMGTEYASFGDLSSPQNTADLTSKQILNRAILAGVMSAAGFIVHHGRWWQFDFAYPAHTAKYPILRDSKLRTGMIVD